MKARVVVWVVAMAVPVALAAAAHLPAPAQPPPAPAQPKPLTKPPKAVTTNPADRPSPPQPHQEQSPEYFVGEWTFTWNGRESALGGGPRSGTSLVSSTVGGSGLNVQIKGTLDGGAAYQESATVEWNPADKTLVVHEKLANGVEMQQTGDWKSAIAIRFESVPVRADGQLVRL